MIKIIKILLFILICSEACYAVGIVGIEPKIGIAPYQMMNSQVESETLYDFFDYGLDIYASIPKTESEIGAGAEIRRLHPKLSDKKSVGLFFFIFKLPTFLDTKIVFRTGFLQSSVFEHSFYYAAGFEKSMNRLVLQLLFDDMLLKNNQGASHYNSIVLKIGIRL